MKLVRSNGLWLLAALVFTGAALGCNEEHEPDGCLWGGTGGGVSFPVCTPVEYKFTGTLDGQPYTLAGPNYYFLRSTARWPPYQLSASLAPGASLDIQWDEDLQDDKWINLTGGMLDLPKELKPRPVLPGSQIKSTCNDTTLLYILHIDGGDLGGCSR